MTGQLALRSRDPGGLAMTIALIDGEDDLAAGLAALVALEPHFGRVHAVIGDPPLRRSPAGFGGLVSIIIAQQVSVASARAIEARVRTVFAPLTPAALAAADDDAYRVAGLSRPKIRTLRSVATALINHRLDLDVLPRLSADEAVRHLTAIHGIGPWTADIYLLFCLGHADAFAPGDLALQEGARWAFGLDSRPATTTLDRMSQAWRPWRGVAARLLFAYYAAVKQGRASAWQSGVSS
jgi:DNA-3-methyladenine glycosylase II